MSLFDEQPFAPVPDRPSLTSLRESIPECRACELWADATQPVMGEGRRDARLMLVGEQPGEVVKPQALVLLGATAAQALLGPHIRIASMDVLVLESEDSMRGAARPD